MSSEAPYQSNDVQHFERWSRTYERSWMQEHFFTRIHQAVLDLAPPSPLPASFLDIGCGTGRLLRAAGARWPEAQLLGVDPAQGMVEIARQLTPQATIERGLAESLPLPDASIDLAVSTMSFHHWHDHAAAARQIARVLRPHGHFLLADFAPPRALGWLPFPEMRMTAARRVAALTAAGLRIERQRTVVYPFVLVTIAVR